MRDIPYFKFWCQKVLPLVYDDSLSYYEVLCKVVEYINELIASDTEIVGEIDKVKADLIKVQEWIDNFKYEPLLETVKEMVDKYLAVGVYFALTDTGYFVATIPKAWDEISFSTTGYDDEVAIQPEFGHLVLSY